MCFLHFWQFNNLYSFATQYKTAEQFYFCVALSNDRRSVATGCESESEVIIIIITTKLKKNNCFALDTTSLNFGALIRKKRKRFKFLNPPERLKIALYFSVNGKFLLIVLPITTFVALTMLACCCYCCCCKGSGCGECLRHICCCCCCDENPSSFSGTVTYSIPSCKSLIKPEWQVRLNIYSINRLREINYPLKCVYYWESRYSVIVLRCFKPHRST